MKKTLLLVVFLFAALSLFAEQSPSGREIMQMTEDAQHSDSSATDMNMILIDSNGRTSIRRLQTLIIDEDGLSRSLTVFKAPASVENTRFLTIENRGRGDDQWIYLPTIRKMRRIASGEKSGSFMGSDFSYSDMESRDIDEYTHTLLREEPVGNQLCWVVESVPLHGTDPGDYSRLVSYVSRDIHVPVRVEYYEDGSSQPAKIMESSDFREISGIWTPFKITMTTVQSGHRTVMEMNQIKMNIPINPGYFTTNFLQTGRLR